jgi:hypothetical protein
MPLAFRAYIRDAAIADTPAGGFIADAKQDARLPEAKSWAELRDYLKERHVGRAAIKAALDAWREFDAAREREA